jgi:S1-C subfamily serine protease
VNDPSARPASVRSRHTDCVNPFRQLSSRVLTVFVLCVAAATIGVGLALARGSATATATNAGIVVVQTKLGYQGGSAAGTGIVLTSSGEVLTNNHVIQGATSVKVTVPGTSHSYSASVVGYSMTGDIAVLKLSGASGLATVSVGDSAKLHVGQHVTAVGNARGRGTLTRSSGSITALGRTITAGDGVNSERLVGLIQTDAALQPGDSGGPLLDASGRVVGIDTAATTGFTFQSTAGGGYAIPIARAVSVAKQIDTGRSTTTVHVGKTAFLGIEVARTSSSGDSLAGVPVGSVLPHSPAARAGLSSGSLVIALDGHNVGSSNALVKLLLLRHPGQKAKLTWVDTSGTQRTTTITLASGPPQ